MLPQEHEALLAECCEDVQAQLAPRSHDGHQVVGAFTFPTLSEEIILTVVRNTIDTVLKVAGPMAVNAALVYKAQIRKIVTPLALTTIDQVIHGLQDAKLAGPG